MRTSYVSKATEAPVRARFTLPEIRQAALKIVDDDGLAGLSMRSLAGTLGTGPMTLYNYVRDREGIEELVVEAVIAEVALPAPSGDWRRDAQAVATALWQTVRAHPAAIPLVLTRRSDSATAFAPAEALIRALSSGGLAELDLLAAFRSVLALVMGAAQAELTGPLAGRVGELAAPGHPHIAALAEASQRSSPEDDFSRGLGFLLDGIATRRAQQDTASARGNRLQAGRSRARGHAVIRCALVKARRPLTPARAGPPSAVGGVRAGRRRRSPSYLEDKVHSLERAAAAPCPVSPAGRSGAGIRATTARSRKWL
jgi:AcrR family transcriptional regulator